MVNDEQVIELVAALNYGIEDWPWYVDTSETEAYRDGAMAQLKPYWKYLQ